jgi:hypothetical protein
VLLARPEYDGLVKGSPVALVILADEDAQEHRVPRDVHWLPSLKLLIETAAACPSQTAIMHSRNDRPTFAPARTISPSRIRLRVWRLKEENVVYPPQRPSVRNWRVSVLTNTRPSRPVTVAKKPIRSEPITLTMSVPHGNVSPK